MRGRLFTVWFMELLHYHINSELTMNGDETSKPLRHQSYEVLNCDEAEQESVVQTPGMIHRDTPSKTFRNITLTQTSTA